MKLPAYGKELLAARRAGKRPATPVVVTDCWGVARVFKAADHYALVCAPASEPCDFTLLYGLHVMVMAGSDDLLGLTERIAQAKPALLEVSRRAELLCVLVRLRERFADAGDARAGEVQRVAREVAAFEALA